MIFTVQNLAETKNSTASIIYLGDTFMGFVIEDGHRSTKDPGVTRIPGGTYATRKRTWGGHYESYRRRFGHEFVLELLDVPGFTSILVHIGNSVDDTSGCLLINTGFYKDSKTGDYVGVQSTQAYLDFYETIKHSNDPIIFKIHR